MVEYVESLEGIKPEHLAGFFVGWPSPPSPSTHLEVLRGSSHVVLAVEKDSGIVLGFITALSDGVLSAHIPLLEVLPDHQHHGIGLKLLQLMLKKLRDLYMVDTMCDEELQSFYEQLDLRAGVGMMLRRPGKIPT